jgi:N6-adenosine-specific RNA methylase IME4
MIPLPRTRGGFACIVADPPWSFRDKGSRIAPDWSAAKAGYRTMRRADIVALPVREIVAPAAHLYLWVTDAHLLDGTALEVIDAWGFRGIQFLDWVKTTQDGRRCARGMGHWFRHTSEHLIFAVRGKAPALRKDLGATFFSPRGRHSAKPDRLQELAELMSPGPRLELFARRARAGWTAWGDQAPERSAA